MIKESDVEEALNYLLESAEIAGKARAERLYLEQWVKTVRAQEITSTPANVSVARADAYAMTSKPYQEALAAYRDAIEIDEKTRFLREAKLALIEAWRTQCSNERAKV